MLILKKLVTLTSLILFSTKVYSTGISIFAPMLPESKPAPGIFSSETLSQFSLFATAGSPNTIYYLPKFSGISVIRDNNNFIKPQFGAFTYTPTQGIFAHEKLLYLSGLWNVAGNSPALQSFIKQATDQGLHPLLVPIKKSTTTFIVTADQIGDGRIDVQCTKEDGINLICKVPSHQSGDFDLNTNIMYQFISMPTSAGTFNNTIPFQAIATPGVDALIQQKLDASAPWDDILLGKITWTIDGQSAIKKLKLNVHWPTLIDQAGTFASFHRYSCIKNEINSFFQKLAQCNDPKKCGILITYQDENGQFVVDEPDSRSKQSGILAVKNYLQELLFNEVAIRDDFGGLENIRFSYIPRANQEKYGNTTIESIILNYSDGNRDFNAATLLNISCLKGDVNSGQIELDLDDTTCRAQFGMQ